MKGAITHMNMKSTMVFAAMAIAVVVAGCVTPQPASAWKGRRVAVFGDSISDAKLKMWRHWWQWVADELGTEMSVYASNGRQWNDVPRQVDAMTKADGADVDAILIFMGTNDFNSNKPLGVWWDEKEETVNRNGRMVKVKRRLPSQDVSTVRGRINVALGKIKNEYPRCQVVLLTPIRRGFFTCAKTNVQPEDSYSNELGLYIGDYARVVREAGEIWSVPVVDTYSESGLLLSMPSYSDCCNRADTDRLHPGTEGCRRLALTVAARLKTLPPTFR